MKTVIVIPHHQPTLDFLEEWRSEFARKNVLVIVVEDKDERVTTVPKNFDNINIYTRKDIKKELKDDAWIIPVSDSAIRSFGYYKAWQKNPDLIITVDNDCFPERKNYYISQHWKALNQKATLGWVKTAHMYTRGFPYNIRDKTEVVINHGLWSRFPDLDAQTALANPKLRFKPTHASQIIPRYNYYPHCGMNFAFKPKVTPILYFGLQGPAYPYARFDDIWAGIFFKKILDHLGLAVSSGKPSVEHRKQSNLEENLRKERPGLVVNEILWKDIDKITLTKTDPKSCYIELAQKLPKYDNYWERLAKAMQIWANLF